MMARKKLILAGAGLLVLAFILSAFFAEQKQSASLHVITVSKPKELHRIFTFTGQRVPFVSAHRGGSLPGYPENCLETFENTLGKTFAIMECDPRYTRDSAIVLHHDPSLGRTVDGKGMLINYSLAELRQMNLKDSKGNITGYHMPTLDEALEWAKGKTMLVLDQKDVPVRARLKKVEEHGAVANVIMIVYSFEEAKLCYSLNKDIIMEVMIPDKEKVLEFDKTGVPWKNVVAFVGHNLPQNAELYRLIHDRGALCMAGSSRNVDRMILSGKTDDISTLRGDYMGFFDIGIDLIETDIPTYLGPLVNAEVSKTYPAKKFFRKI